MDEKIEVPFKIGDFLSVEQAMNLAIQEAQLGASFVSPNPLVGCVILDSNNRFMASGYHHKFGGPHAEIDALEKLNPDQLIQATLYVTLEPCAHRGKTGSCAKKLATAKIKKVVYGLEDPNPLVAGQGAQILKDAGIEAIEYVGPLKSELYQLCEVFLKNMIQNKVFVAAKVATSLDGQIALKSGESKWITSEASRDYVHELRSYYDAILVGRKTIEIDDPSLNIRHSKISKENKIIVLDPAAKILTKLISGQNFKFIKAHKPENIFFAVHRKVDSPYNQVEFTDLLDLMNQLWKHNIRSILIEGGAATYSSFLNAELIDRIYIFMAPVLLGAGGSVSWTQGFSMPTLEKKIELQSFKVKSIGSDVLFTGLPKFH